MASDAVVLPGELSVPPDALGLVVFAHGSGSGRLSPRNQAVARSLNGAGLGTLLFDLLTEDEASDRRHVFDVHLLADRLLGVTGWARRHPGCTDLSLGYFGASTGAAAALLAASRDGVGAIVSRGGRPDLAWPALQDVRAPTLLIVGGEDPQVLALNTEVMGRLGGHVRLEVVPGATHLFEEPGALEQVAHLAAGWFLRYLPLRETSG